MVAVGVPHDGTISRRSPAYGRSCNAPGKRLSRSCSIFVFTCRKATLISEPPYPAPILHQNMPSFSSGPTFPHTRRRRRILPFCILGSPEDAALCPLRPPGQGDAMHKDACRGRRRSRRHDENSRQWRLAPRNNGAPPCGGRKATGGRERGGSWWILCSFQFAPYRANVISAIRAPAPACL